MLPSARAMYYLCLVPVVLGGIVCHIGGVCAGEAHHLFAHSCRCQAGGPLLRCDQVLGLVLPRCEPSVVCLPSCHGVSLLISPGGGGDLFLDAEDGCLELLYQDVLFSALPLHEVQDVLLCVGVWPCGDPAIFEDLGAGGRGKDGAVLDCDNEGLLRGDQAGLLDPGAVMPEAVGAIVFAMLGCNGDVW